VHTLNLLEFVCFIGPCSKSEVAGVQGEKIRNPKNGLGHVQGKLSLGLSQRAGPRHRREPSVPPYEVRGAAGDVKPTHEFEGWPAFSGYSVSAIKTPGLLISTIKTPEPYL